MAKLRRIQFLAQAIANHKSDECLLWPYGRMKGYGTVKFQGRDMLVHRVAYYLTRGEWPLPIARHTCDTPACFNPLHIVSGTAADNAADMVARNRCSRHHKNAGAAHGRAKITDDIVRAIRAEYRPKNSGMLAKRYGLHYNTVRDIAKGKAWKHVNPYPCVSGQDGACTPNTK